MYPIAKTAGKFAAGKCVEADKCAAAQDRTPADRLLVPRLPMLAHHAHPQLVAAAVNNMPATSRTKAENPNRQLPNKAAGWTTNGGAYLLRRFGVCSKTPLGPSKESLLAKRLHPQQQQGSDQFAGREWPR